MRIKHILSFLLISSFYFVFTETVVGQATNFTDGDLSVDVFVSNPCDGVDNGEITFTIVAVNGGTATITITGPDADHSSGATDVTRGDSFTFNAAGRGLIAGSYDFNIVDPAMPGDVINGSIVLENLTAISIIKITERGNNSCTAPLTGQVEASITGGSLGLNAGAGAGPGSFSYTWTSDNGLAVLPLGPILWDGVGILDLATLLAIPGLPEGTYTILVEDRNSMCSATESFTITDPFPNTYTIISTTPTICRGRDLDIVMGGSDLASGAEPDVEYVIYQNGTETSVTKIGTGAAPFTITISMMDFVVNDGDVITVRANQGVCNQVVMTGMATVAVAEIPDLDPSLNATVCSDAVTGITLGVDAGSIAATTYNITAINRNGLVASAGNPETGEGFDTNEISDDAWTNTTGDDVDVEYTVAPVNDACVGTGVVVRVTITAEPILDRSLDATVCSDAVTGITLGVAAGSVAATTYNITEINRNGLVAGVGNSSVGVVNANGISGDVWENMGTRDVDVEYTVAPVNGTCVGEEEVVKVTITAEPILDPALEATVCSGAMTEITLGVAAGSVAATAYNITAIARNGLVAIAGSPRAGDGFNDRIIANDVWTNTTGGDLVVEYTVAPVNGACVGTGVAVRVTVTSAPVLDYYIKCNCL